MKKIVALLVGLVLAASAAGQTWQRIGQTPTNASSGGICSTVGQYGTDWAGNPYVCKFQPDWSGKWVSVGGDPSLPSGTLAGYIQNTNANIFQYPVISTSCTGFACTYNCAPGWSSRFSYVGLDQTVFTNVCIKQ